MKNSFSKIPGGVWVLGFVSLLMDTSSELIFSLLPLFLVVALQASASTLGVIEGVAEATALFLKAFSGALSDYLRQRKTLALLGYGLSALSKPLFALATSTGIVFLARFIDRTGKGIRGAPRDALIADITPAGMRGASYGLRQALDTVGAFAGPLLGIALMFLWNNNFQLVFWVATIPAVASVLLLFFGVQEPEKQANEKKSLVLHWNELKRLTSDYWWVVAIGSIFTLARFSEAFLILRAKEVGLSLTFAPLVYVAMNFVAASTSYPFGRLADKMSHRVLLVLGLVVLILADLFLAQGSSLLPIFCGISLWGLHLGITQGLLSKLVADTAPANLRGTAFGCFYLFGGLTLLIASILAGLLWDLVGPPATFYAGAFFCLVALALIAKVARPGRPAI